MVGWGGVGGGENGFENVIQAGQVQTNPFDDYTRNGRPGAGAARDGRVSAGAGREAALRRYGETVTRTRFTRSITLSLWD